MSSNQTDPNDPSASIGHPQIVPTDGTWFYRSYNQETDYVERWLPVIAWVMLPDEPQHGRPNVVGVFVDKYGRIAYTDASGELRTREQIQVQRQGR